MHSFHLAVGVLTLAVVTSTACSATNAVSPTMDSAQLAQAPDAAPAPQNPAPHVPPPLPAQEQPEALTSGPVHEGFAEPVDLQAQPGIVAPSEPPANVEEVPPADRPVGNHFVWIPGYWSWDADRKTYIWVSACWRAAPPNMDWVPGYWARVAQGWQWVPGFWAPTGGQEVEYISAPPPPEDATPAGPPPSPDATWVPPCSYWAQDQYVPRPGYWLTAQVGWVWTPSHYAWTPRGYVFCHGHWDYPLGNRGVLFAPVAFSPAVYARGGFSFSPSIVVNLGGIEASLFVCPSYSHYYFGDYYDDAYVRNGIYPRFQSGRTWCDPLYTYDRWHYGRTNPRWEQERRHDYDLRRADRDLRPPRTYHEMEARVAKAPEPQRKNLRIAEPLTTVVASKATPMKFQQMDVPARQQIAQRAAEVPKFRDQRNAWESKPAAAKTPPSLAEHRGAAPVVESPKTVAPPGAQAPAGQRHEPAPAVAEPKASAAAPPERREPAVAPVAQPKAPETPRVEPKAPAAPAEHHAAPAPAVEPKAPGKEPSAPPAAEHKPAPAAEPKTPPPAPHESRPPEAEKIKTPPSPISGRSAEKAPPERPSAEHQAKPDAKDAHPDQGGHKGN